jgi:hypothetical protein
MRRKTTDYNNDNIDDGDTIDVVHHNQECLLSPSFREYSKNSNFVLDLVACTGGVVCMTVNGDRLYDYLYACWKDSSQPCRFACIQSNGNVRGYIWWCIESIMQLKDQPSILAFILQGDNQKPILTRDGYHYRKGEVRRTLLFYKWLNGLNNHCPLLLGEELRKCLKEMKYGLITKNLNVFMCLKASLPCCDLVACIIELYDQVKT